MIFRVASFTGRRRSGHHVAAAASLATLVVAFSIGRTPHPSAQAAPPLTLSAMWLAPESEPAITSPFMRAIDSLDAGRPELVISALGGLKSDPMLGGYAQLYIGRAQLAMRQADRAAASARDILRTAPGGYLGESALWLLAEANETSADWTDAVHTLEALADLKATNQPQVNLRLGRAAAHTGDSALAVRAFRRVYYDFPLSAEAPDAFTELAKFTTIGPTDTYAQELGRAQTLYSARRYTDARKAYDLLRGRAAGDDRSLVDLRLAECDYGLGRHAAARSALTAYLDRATERRREAQYFYLSATRGLGRDEEYIALVRDFAGVDDPDGFAEIALNDLATYYILEDEDGKAAETFAEMYRRFPKGIYADRAAWRAGWWAYKNADYATVVRLFESAATTFPRADYRPAWLYWAARAHEKLGERPAAILGLRQVISDYRNSYYGREATRAAEALVGPARSGASAAAAGLASPRRDTPPLVVPGLPPANAPLIRRLLAVGLYEDAIGELRRVQSQSGTSPLLDATVAYALNRKGELRPAITAMRRAYPQFLAAGGELLPRPILTVIFPVEYGDLIQKYAKARDLDPYLMAALVAQESTFQADIKSSANAWGLMQILPSTGRRYAQRLGIRPFSTRRLTEPDVNVRIGMAYFADLVTQFGGVAPALAAYNAGESRVQRWLGERPGASRDEFVDDIPFPETQNYLKRILGTSEDYRVLYRDLGPAAPRRAGQ